VVCTRDVDCATRKEGAVTDGDKDSGVAVTYDVKKGTAIKSVKSGHL
jgi:hypothetical protein